ncbi:MAG: ABC transporter permease subunit, partial [Gemmataceae bacterium]
DVWRAGLDALGWPAWLAGPLWYGPSYVPAGWVMLIRVFPFALAAVDPAVRAIPGELYDAARLDGVGRWQELRRLVVPLTARAWGVAAWAGMVLGLGELSAAKLVSTPGAETFAEMVFSQLHYGVSADLAGRCLVMAAAVLATTPVVIRASRGLTR